MSISQIPVRVTGPGSQPDTGQELRYIDMPNDMSTYHAPHVPEPETVQHLDGARDAMRWLGNALAAYEEGAPAQLADLTGLDPESRELVNQILGEGEVSVILNGDVAARCQESVLAGVWRTVYFDEQDCVIGDLLEVASTPHLLSETAQGEKPIDVSAPAEAGDVLNALPILVELEAHAESYANDGTPHAINLTLLPLSEAEIGFLEERLGQGRVEVLSRGYGNCQVTSTATPNVWWVRYRNSMGNLILNSLEVVGVPAVVNAAAEDLRDSEERLRDILAPYWRDDT